MVHFMAILLDVPFFTQLGIGGHVRGQTARDDPTGCWYASACMVGAYHEEGPRLGVPELFNRALPGGGTGHQRISENMAIAGFGGRVDAFLLLAKREGMDAIPSGADPLFYIETADIEPWLRQRGPIMFCWRKNGYDHCSVITGVEGSDIHYHDPESAPSSVMAERSFNSLRLRFRWGLMARLPSRARQPPRLAPG